MKRVWIKAKHDVPESTAYARSLASALNAAGFELCTDLETAPDLIIVISGDGTLLATLQEMGQKRWEIPVLAIHGSYGLGFLHSLAFPEVESQYELHARTLALSLRGGQFKLINRWSLQALLHSTDKKRHDPLWAFNDFVVAKGALSRMVRLRVEVDGTVIMDKARGDGMIFSSANGSTAYSMSAGGPVVHPSLEALVLTPVCLHRMSQRPIVFGPDSTVMIEILESSSSCYITVDGQRGFELEVGQRLEVSCAGKSIKWLHFLNPAIVQFEYYKVLQEKLGFGG